MSTTDLLIKILKRLKKFRILILLCGVGVAGLLYIYAKRIKTVYTSRASVFPLTASSDNSSVNGTLQSILGLGEAPKSFSGEAAINIIELATSRTTREAVAMERLDTFNHKTVAELLIRTANDKDLNDKKFSVTTDTIQLATQGGNLIKAGLQAKINKNGILEINFSSTNEKIISPISYVIVQKISEFYRNLRISKAKRDYDFTVTKVDSLDHQLDSIDNIAIHMYKTTQFTPSDRLEYSIPKENLAALKERAMRQRDVAANNREEALWRLQKQTPIISILDKPDPPFEVKKSSPMFYGIMGFLVGCLLAIGLFSGGLILKYAETEVQKALFKNNPPAAEAHPEANPPVVPVTPHNGS